MEINKYWNIWTLTLITYPFCLISSAQRQSIESTNFMKVSSGFLPFSPRLHSVTGSDLWSSWHESFFRPCSKDTWWDSSQNFEHVPPWRSLFGLWATEWQALTCALGHYFAGRVIQPAFYLSLIRSHLSPKFHDTSEPSSFHLGNNRTHSVMREAFPDHETFSPSKSKFCLFGYDGWI